MSKPVGLLTDDPAGLDLWRRLYERSGIAIFQSSPEGHYIRANPAGARMHGYDSEAALLQAVRDIGREVYCNPKDRETMRALIEEHGAVEGFECQIYRHRTGERFWVRQNIYPVTDDDGRLLHWEGYVEDVTDRKRAEEALQRYRDDLERRVEERTAQLREREERYRTIFDGASVGIGRIWLGTGRLIVSNETLARIFGFDTVKDFVAEFVFTEHYVDPADHARLMESYETAPGTPIECAFVKRDGSPVIVQAHAMVNDAEGYLDVVAIDITSQKRAERALVESEKRLSSLLENSPSAICMHDVSGRFRMVNTRFCEWFGMTAEDVIGKTTHEAASLEFGERCLRMHNEVLTTGETREEEFELPFADGTLHSVIVTKFPVSGPDGMTVGVGAIKTDNTERKRAEEAIRISQQRLQRTVTLASVGYFVWDIVEDKCIDCSEEYARLHGMTVAEYMEQSATLERDILHVHPDDRESYQALYEASRDGRIPFNMEYRMLSSSGETRYIREVEEHVEFVDGRAARAEGMIQDITDLKRAEEDLRRSEENLRNVVDQAGDALFIIEPTNGRFLDVNTQACTSLGYSRDELLTLSVAEIDIDYIAKNLRAPTARLVPGEVVAIEGTHQRKDGSVFPVEIRVSAMHMQGQRRTLALARDITERRRAEERLRQAQKMEAVGQLTGGVAHDFNNILAVIRGNGQLLADIDGLDSPFLKAILSATDRGADLTHRLLAFSRRQALQPRATDIARLTEGMRELLCRTLGAMIEIEIRADDALWPAMADPGQVESAVLNLALNARDAMPRGGRLTIECANARLDEASAAEAPDAPAGDYVMLAVSDEGDGMSAEVQAHAFEPFFTTKGVGKGTGLGLSMVYGFARQSGGHVTIRSAEGQGTTVTLYLPCAAEAASQEEAGPDQPAPQGNGEAILVIEDDPDVRVLTVRLLRSLNYRVIDVGTAAAAGDALAEGSAVDLVLSDVVLPDGVSGPEFAQRAREAYPDLRVIFMSGYAPDGAMANGPLGAGSVLLNKPFQKGQLARALREALDGGTAHGEVPPPRSG